MEAQEDRGSARETFAALGGWHLPRDHGQVWRDGHWRWQGDLENEVSEQEADRRALGPDNHRPGEAPTVGDERQRPEHGW